MERLAIIGGTGLESINGLSIIEKKNVETPYGPTSSAFVYGELDGCEIVFLSRHGTDHTISPHKVNYRANIWGLHSIGITNIIAVASVGGINSNTPPKKIVIPDQIIDYTYSRKQTFFEDRSNHVTHIDFSQPYCNEMRQILLQAARVLDFDVCIGGTYGAAQGPRLETAAEINRMEKDGCDIVGMTGMPEAALAKELELCYATCALSVNWAAGRDNMEITMSNIKQSAKEGMVSVNKLLVVSAKLFKNK